MHRHAVKKNVTQHDNLGWRQALADAEAKLEKAKSDVRGLELAIETCRERVRENAPWPGGATQN